MRRQLLLVLTLSAGIGMHVHAQEDKSPLASLIAQFDKDDKSRLLALAELEKLGPKAADAVPDIISLFDRGNEDVRLHAALLMGKIGPAAVPRLTKTLTSTEAHVRFYAVWSLAFIGARAKSAAPEVAKLMGDASADVRRKAAYTLGRIDPSPADVIDILVASLADLDADVAAAAADTLPRMGPAAVAALRKALKEENVNARKLAVQTLGALGPSAAKSVPELEAMLLAFDKVTASDAANTLARIGPEGLPALTRAAAHDNPGIRSLALAGLHTMSAPAVPTLVDLLGSKHVDVRRTVPHFLRALQVSDKMVVIGLGYALKDADSEVRLNSLLALYTLGPAAKLAEPYVSAALIDIDPEVRRQAFGTLRNMGADPRPGLKKALAHPDFDVRLKTAALMSDLNLEVDLAEPVLLEGLKQKDEALKMQAAYSLAQRGMQVDIVLPIFITGLKNEVASVRRQAAQAIARYGPKGKQATPALLAALDDKDDSVSSQALQTLKVLGADAKFLFPAMIQILRRSETKLHADAAQIIFQVGPGALGEIIDLLKKEKAPGIRLVCLQTLAMVGPPAEPALPLLIDAMSDPAPRARLSAARALGNIGPAATTAKDALLAAKKDADANVRLAAMASLVQIQAQGDLKTFVVKGVLTTGDPLDKIRAGSSHVVHTFPMKEGSSYTIDLTAPWDTFLRLENNQGQQLAFDDDGGGGLNSRINFRAPKDGLYRIIVTSFAAKASGPYQLKVVTK